MWRDLREFYNLTGAFENCYKENKKGTKQVETDLSPSVARPGFEPGTSGL